MSEYIQYVIEAIVNPKSIFDLIIVLHLFLFLLCMYYLIRAAIYKHINK